MEWEEPLVGELPRDDMGSLSVRRPVPDRGAGDVWLTSATGIDAGTGEEVLLRRLALPPDRSVRAHAALLARRLLNVEHTHLVPVIDVATRWDGLDLVVRAREVSTSLASLLATRRLTAGEVLRMGAGLADALACLHEAGLTHGRLRAGDVLLVRDGTAVLTGYGAAGIQGSAGLPADDVRDLAALLRLALDPDDRSPETPAVQAVLHAFADGPARPPRPGPDPDGAAVELVTQLAALGPGRSVRLGAAAPGAPLLRPGREHRHRRRRPRTHGSRRLPLRPVAVALPALLAVLLLAGWLGARLPPAEGAAGAVVSPGSQPSASPTSRSSPPPSGPSGPSLRPSPSPAASASPDWWAVLTGLDDARERLFAAPDERQIGAVDAPGSSAYAYDLAAV